MRLCLPSFLLVAVLSANFSVAEAKSGEPRIMILIQPTAQSFVSVESVRLKASITNHSRNDIAFSDCPNPYKVEVSDQLGNVIPHKPAAVLKSSVNTDGTFTINNLPMCVHSFARVIKPDDTWTEEITLSGLVDLKSPGIYSTQMTWEFSTNAGKIGGRVSFKTLQIPSNRTNITIGE
jgi:hypothetical protein